MALKKYHVSANKFDVNGTYSLKASAITITDNSLVDVNQSSGAADRIYYDKVYPSGTYTISLKADNTLARFFSPMQYSGGTYNSYYGGYYKDFESDNVMTLTFETDFTIGFIFRGSGRAVMSEIMLNTGSTALPYEPYGNTWNDIPYRRYETATDTVTNLPVQLFTDGQPITTWSMDGNTETSGTPSPSNPITIAGCGDKTANLWSAGNISIALHDRRVIVPIELPANTYTMSFIYTSTNTAYVPVIAEDSEGTLHTYIFYPSQGRNYVTIDNLTDPIASIYLYSATGYNVSYDYAADYTDIMLCEGTSTAYEPYGMYKISISSNQTALNPMYLTEPMMKVDTYSDSVVSSGTVTRNIYKLVLTGQENITTSSNYYVVPVAVPTIDRTSFICSHFSAANYSGAITQGAARFAQSSVFYDQIIFNYDNGSGGTDTFKTYLQQQYTNGTPVTIYYVLETATTESVTAPSIPTTGGEVSIDVDTTVKPSEFDLTYHGWHEHQPLKRENGQWS